VDNAHFQAREWGEEVLFLRRLVAGGASRSYGIQVARLAGLPAAVIERAREILNNLESGEFDERGRPRLASHEGAPAPAGAGAAASEHDQLRLFSAPALGAAERDALEALGCVDPDRTTPLEALELLTALVRRLGREDDS
jgi:DNA mismatch repair protein MutS